MRRFKKTYLIGFLIIAIVAVLLIVNSVSTPMSLGLMGSAEQLKITELRFIDGNANDTVKALVRNSGSNTVRIVHGYLNGTKSTTISSTPAFIAGKYSGLITLVLPANTLTDGNDYLVKLVTAKGNTIVFHSTYSSTFSAQQNTMIDEPFATPYPPATETPHVDYRWNQFVTALGYCAIVAAVSVTLVVYLKKRKNLLSTEVALLAVAFNLISFLLPSSLTSIGSLNPWYIFLGIIFFVLSFGLIHYTRLIKDKQGERARFFVLFLPIVVIVSSYTDFFIIIGLSPMMTM
jgi:hypothetical protein